MWRPSSTSTGRSTSGGTGGGSVTAFLQSLRAEAPDRFGAVLESPARPSDDSPFPTDLDPRLVDILKTIGRPNLWSHQRAAIDHARAGHHVVLATETSSGKTLSFQLPVMESLLRDPSARALFLFPTNPLANDQEASLRRWIPHWPPGTEPPRIVRLQGNMGAQKNALAASDPQICITNPEMLHLHLLPRHRQWASLWKGLRWIVVDEIHLYRGAFGGHLAHVLRRARRCAWRHGAKPVVIAASATVGNPVPLATELCAAPFELVDRSSAPRGHRTTVVWNIPTEGSERVDSSAEAVRIFRRALDSQLQAILFARSRQQVEQLVRELEQQTGQSRTQLRVQAYRGGYLRDDRERIESQLRSGQLRGVVTTNALEVGIDIGSLDVCVIAGYPGSVMALRQQAGRVGRRDRPSAVFLVPAPNPLDAYVRSHPQILVDSPAEPALVARQNPHIVRAHIACAAAEFPLWEAEIDRLGGDVARQQAESLVQTEEADWDVTPEGRRVLVARRFAHHTISLRSASQERFELIDPDGERVGEVDAASVAREAHVGAIYLHQGRTFRVDHHDGRRIVLADERPGRTTRVQGDRTVETVHVLRERRLPGGVARHAVVQIVDTYSKFLETTGPGRRPFTQVLDPPVQSALRTEALLLDVDSMRHTFGTSSDPSSTERFDAALHGAEHLLSALAATIVLCDRDDIEGHTLGGDRGSIVLFDRHPGGLGLAATGFDQVEAMLARALEQVEGCRCAEGCPACVHGGRCLRSADPLSKDGARLILRGLQGLTVDVVSPGRTPSVTKSRQSQSTSEAVPPRRRTRAREPDIAARPVRPFEPLDTVEHPTLGRGVVADWTDTGRVVVDFDDGSRRKIAPGWLRKVL